MPAKRNNLIPNGHFHKDWQRYIKLWFNQPMRKARRHRTRVEKAKRLAPRPAAGLLRPVVSCPTLRYNSKLRLGRGFTLEELKQADINKHEARKIGVSVDHRRKNKSVDSLQRNVQRLKEYKSRLIVFPHNPKKPHKGDSSAEEVKLATQLKGVILPPKQRSSRKLESARVPTKEEKEFKAYKYIRKSRSVQKYKGKRERKARLDAEAAENKK